MPSVPLVLDSGHYMETLGEISQGLWHDVQEVQRAPGAWMDVTMDAYLHRHSQLRSGDVLREG